MGTVTQCGIPVEVSNGVLRESWFPPVIFLGVCMASTCQMFHSLVRGYESLSDDERVSNISRSRSLSSTTAIPVYFASPAKLWRYFSGTGRQYRNAFIRSRRAPRSHFANFSDDKTSAARLVSTRILSASKRFCPLNSSFFWWIVRPRRPYSSQRFLSACSVSALFAG